MWKKIFKLFVILYLPLLLLSMVLFIYQKKEHIAYYTKLQVRETGIKKELFNDLFHTPIRNANFWSQLQYPKDFDPLNSHEAFMKPYIDIIKGVTDYDQFRFLDLNGQEIFRVERKRSDSIILGDLQRKNSRSYFIEGIRLHEGQLYLSPINLNREYGAIETPYKPVIRIVGPIFDVTNEQIGLVVINFKMESILERLKENVVDNNFYLINERLQVITSNTQKEHVAFEISNSIQPLNKTYGLEKSLFKKDTTFLRDDHVWSVKAINLNSPERASSFGENLPLEIVTLSNWSVVQEMPPHFLHDSLHLLYLGVGVFNALAILLLLTLSYFLVKGRMQKKSYLHDLETKNARLYKKRLLLKENNTKISAINHRLGIRNKQLSEFNYLVSHNLKAPVTSMAVIVDMMKKKPEPQNIIELLPKLNQITESISELTKDIGEYVSILDEKKVKLESVDLGLLIEQVKIDFFETLLDYQDFEVLVELNSWQDVMFSKFYLHSVFHNLISNSIKYRRDGVASFIKFTSSFENEKKVLYVTDNGIGIDLTKHGNNMFKLYKRFHRNMSGKGIGLFLVKSQLEALDATIAIESKENAGTTYKIIF